MILGEIEGTCMRIAETDRGRPTAYLLILNLAPVYPDQCTL